MRDVSIRVMNMVRRTLVENPEISNEALYSAAVALDPSIAKLTLRQFHARYPLQVRRWEIGGPSVRLRRPPPQRTAEPVDGAEAPPKQPAREESAAAPRVRVQPHDPSTPWPMEVWPQAAAVRPPREPRRKKPAPEPVPAPSESVEAPAVAARARGPSYAAADRDGVRHALFRFAAEIAAAETASEMATALRSIDEHVGRVLAHAGA